MSAHSNLGPSSAERWMNCAGSVRLAATVPPQPTSEAAAEGTVAHSLAELLVTGKADVMELTGRIGEIVVQEGHDIEISEEMVDGAIEYADLIASDRREIDKMGHPAPTVGAAEVRVHAKTVHADLWGTADYLLYQKGNRLIVYDYKFGKGVVVEVAENPQAGIYAIAAMEGPAGAAYDAVELVIHQPRARHQDGVVRRWTASREWLSAFRKRVDAAAQATTGPNPPLKAGSWCKWCPALAVCPEITRASQEAAQTDFSVVLPPPKGSTIGLPAVEGLPIERLTFVLEWEDAVKSWIGAIKDRVQGMLESGQAVPGWKLVDGRSLRSWRSEAEVKARFEATLGAKIWAEPKLLSPAQMEKIVGKGKLEELGLTEKLPGKKSIAKDTDPRPTATSSAADDFAAVVAEGPKGLPPIGQNGVTDLERELLGGGPAVEEDPLAEIKTAEPMWPV